MLSRLSMVMKNPPPETIPPSLPGTAPAANMRPVSTSVMVTQSKRYWKPRLTAPTVFLRTSTRSFQYLEVNGSSRLSGVSLPIP